MTDRQRLTKLLAAEQALKRTRNGYTPTGVHWRTAMKLINEVQRDLTPSPVPNLGPVWRGGKSVLNHDLTHPTSGIPLYPAFDDAFVQGRVIIAPEAITVTRDSSANPGDAFYATGQSKIRWWFGHLRAAPKVGTKFVKGEQVGTVAPNSVGGGPHVHVGVNVELLLGAGRELVHHTNYTHGAPTVGSQLERLMGL